MYLSSDVWFSILSALPNFPYYRNNTTIKYVASYIPQVVFLSPECVKEIFLTEQHFKSFVSFKNIGVELKRNSKKFNDKNAAYFRGIHTFNISGCDQETITGQALSYPQGICIIDMCICNKSFNYFRT
jgi:hypothetical protein